MPYERDRPGLVAGPVLYNAGFESLAMVKLFDPDEFATPPTLADPIAFSDSDRVSSVRTGKGKARCCEGRHGRCGDARCSLGEFAGGRTAHQHSPHSALQALHSGAAFDRSAWENLDFEQIDGSTRTAYLPVVTLNEDSDD